MCVFPELCINFPNRTVHQIRLLLSFFLWILPFLSKYHMCTSFHIYCSGVDIFFFIQFLLFFPHSCCFSPYFTVCLFVWFSCSPPSPDWNPSSHTPASLSPILNNRLLSDSLTYQTSLCFWCKSSYRRCLSVSPSFRKEKRPFSPYASPRNTLLPFFFLQTQSHSRNKRSNISWCRLGAFFGEIWLYSMINANIKSTEVLFVTVQTKDPSWRPSARGLKCAVYKDMKVQDDCHCVCLSIPFSAKHCLGFIESKQIVECKRVEEESFLVFIMQWI